MKSYRADIETLIPALRQFARALLADHRPDFADDLVHSTLTHALRAERSWGREDLAPRVLAQLIAANRLRGRTDVAESRSVQGGSQGEASRGRPSSQPHPAQGPAGPLGALALADREALLLVVLAGLDYGQAAQVLGVPIGTLVTRLTNARERLGQTLWTEADGVAATGGTRRPGAAHLRLVKS